MFGEDGEEPLTINNSEAFWFADNVGDAVCYGEHAYSFNDIITDLKEDAHVGEIIKYEDYRNYCYDQSITPINYYAWLHGAPRFNNKLKRNEK